MALSSESFTISPNATWYILSHTFIVLLFSLFLYYYCPIKKEEKRLSLKLFDFGCQNITPLYF